MEFHTYLHGAFLERKFDMKERISTCTWDRLGTPPRLKKNVTFKKILGALFEKSAHSGIFYDLQLKFAIKKAFIQHKPNSFDKK